MQRERRLPRYMFRKLACSRAELVGAGRAGRWRGFWAWLQPLHMSYSNWLAVAQGDHSPFLAS